MKSLKTLAILFVMVAGINCGGPTPPHMNGEWVYPETVTASVAGIDIWLNSDFQGIYVKNTNDKVTSVEIINQTSQATMFDRTEIPMLAGEEDKNENAECAVGETLCVKVWSYLDYFSTLINQTAPNASACYLVYSDRLEQLDETMTYPFEVSLPIVNSAECKISGHSAEDKPEEQYDLTIACTKHHYRVSINFAEYGNFGTASAPEYRVTQYLTEKPIKLGMIDTRDVVPLKESIDPGQVYGLEVCYYSITEAIDDWSIHSLYSCNAVVFKINITDGSYELMPGDVIME
jgi:hypothetical protein